MRSDLILGVLVISLLSACAPSKPTSEGDAPGSRGRVFPAPSQLVNAAMLEGSGEASEKAGAPNAKALIVGRKENPRAIRFEFDRPMKTFDGTVGLTEVSKPLALESNFAEVVASWVNSRVLEVVPRTTWPNATLIEVAVTSAEARNGAPLGAAVRQTFVSNPLRVVSSPSSKVQPNAFYGETGIDLRTSLPLTPDELSRHLQVRSWLDDDRKPESEAFLVSQKDSPTEFFVALKTAPRYERTYEFRVSKELSGPYPVSFDEDWVTYVKGPPRLAVSGIYCNWGGCPPGKPWTVGFIGPVSQDSVAKCISTRPRLDLGTMTVEGWSVTFTPIGAKIGQTYKVIVDRSCRDIHGEPMKSGFESSIEVLPPYPELAMVTGTGFLPANPKAEILVRAAHTGPSKVEFARIEKAELPVFLKNNLESWGGLSLREINAQQTMTLPPTTDSRLLSLPLEKALRDGFGLVQVRVQTDNVPPATEPISQSALVQVTDLSITAKTSPSDTLVWVTSLSERTPLSGVEVLAISADGETIWKGLTDATGLAVGPVTFTNEGSSKSARVIVASRGEDLAFIDLNTWEIKTEPYSFNLPYEWDAVADHLRGLVFTERGVYRSGETVHIKGYLRLDRGRALESLVGESVQVEIHDPLGEVVLTRELTLGAANDFELDLPLGAKANLGSWDITAKISKSNSKVGSTFRVEAYRPNTFEVEVGDLSVSGEGEKRLVTDIEGRYFHGATMADAQVRWWLTSAEADIAPTGFETYSFGVSTWEDYWWEPSGRSVETLASGSGNLDGEGRLHIDTPIVTLPPATNETTGNNEGTRVESPGPRLLTLESQVSDVDAQAVAGRSSVRVESSDHYFGLKLSSTFAGVEEPIDVDAVAVTPEGSNIKARASLTWIHRTWKSERVPSAGGGFEWRSSTHDEILENRDIDVGDTTRVATLKASEAGTYIVELAGEDAHGRPIRTRLEVWVWGGNASWTSENDNVVGLIAERDRWKVGDTARFVVQSPFDEADALITIERNGNLSRQVKRLTGRAPLIEVSVTEDMQPNAYLSVVLLGASDKGPEGAARLGYAQLLVDTEDRRLSVSVNPEAKEYRPGEKVRAAIEVKNMRGEPVSGEVAFMAVDEGVLSLTGYKTPDPHAALYKARPLAVTNYEARRLLWRDRTIEEVKSDWGGGGEGGEATNYRSAFATTAAFMPDVAVGPDGRATVEFTLPDNLTTFRLMAVAASSDGRFGNAESKIISNRPLMIRPGLPRFISVGDAFDARAIVQAVDPNLIASQSELVVDLKVSGPVSLEGKSSVSLKASSKATPVQFRVKANAPGQATFAFRVTGGNVSDAFEVSLPVQWPATLKSAWEAGTLASGSDGESFEIQLPSWIHGAVGGLEITVSTSRIGELLPGLGYLLQYPYGCIEQTTGGTLPLVALKELQQGFSLPGISGDAILSRAQAGLDRIVSMQTWSGGLAYWPGEESPHPWGSVYGGLALVTASRMPGLNVRKEALDKLKTYLDTIMTGEAIAAQDEWRSELDVTKPFAAWLLALMGQSNPSSLASLFANQSKMPDFAKLMLALAIDESKGDASMVKTLLDTVVSHVTLEGERAFLKRDSDRYYHSTMDSDARNQALLVLVMERVRPNDPLLPKLVYGLLSTRERGEWATTQDNAFAILALARHFIRTESNLEPTTVVIDVADRKDSSTFESADTVAHVLEIPMQDLKPLSGKTLSIRRDKGNAPVYWSLRLNYADEKPPRMDQTAGFTVTRSYLYASGDKKGQPVTNLRAGDLVLVTLDIDTPDDRRYVAVDDPLPAGLEAVTLDFATAGDFEAGLVASPYYSAFNHKEQRDDRVLLFADWMPAGAHSHQYLARATTHGAFFAAPTHVSEMYHPNIYGLSTGRDLSVL